MAEGSNIKAAPLEITPDMASRVMEWLNAQRDDSMLRPMSRREIAQLRRGDALIMHEATMGEGADGVERIYAPGTPAIFWLLERFGPPTGWAVTLVIGGSFEDDKAIVNTFYETDRAGFPFRCAEGADA
ncbi:hypothetical protein [Sphingobium ummariense]|uniref:Uncharacterized protein n=1 Tax=Sphingobium ummariense RL-3 TaxID=1346791 RepID=T0J599_9SPHN|nr:hypothetical protein [Sphingobium ummariense]EQB32017.1 hypothetical protein M529_11775 [Sphingobium ummariense RL-3]